jgi:hypothetical protein
MKGWIGVDLDGTLAEWHGWHDDGGIGPPIPIMLDRVKAWLTQGQEVRIMTARVGASGKWSEKAGRYDDEAFAELQRTAIENWCLQHLGQALPVTATKDMDMLCIWDDRAVAVEKNTGQAYSFRTEFLHSTEE